MALDKKELEKLIPEERIKKLKELEQKLTEERRKESAEIEALLKRSVEELRTDKIAEKVAPKQNDDITSRFLPGELEAQRPRKKTQEEEPAIAYSLGKQLVEDYSSIKDLLGYELTPGSLDRQQVRKLEDIQGRIVKASYQSLSHSDQMAVLVSATKEALYRVRKYSGIE